MTSVRVVIGIVVLLTACSPRATPGPSSGAPGSGTRNVDVSDWWCVRPGVQDAADCFQGRMRCANMASIAEERDGVRRSCTSVTIVYCFTVDYSTEVWRQCFETSGLCDRVLIATQETTHSGEVGGKCFAIEANATSPQ
jgi:hypothetical protein